MSDQIHEILSKYWGYDSFRPLQEETIRAVLSGRDTLALLPTGGGKSIIFQVAGLALGGLTVVVTPLISLMKDQVDNLRKRRIKSAFFHAAMTNREISATWDLLQSGRCEFIYVSPERLRNDNFVRRLAMFKPKLMVVDEAHCISQWGYDFRPAYLEIGKLRKLLPGIPVLALTASATPRVADDICLRLGMKNPARFVMSFSRPNISYVVRKTYQKINELEHILSKTSGSAIIYTRSRKRAADIAKHLTSIGLPTLYYHAGLDYKEKEERQTAWMQGKYRVIAATNAFGMGIDKPDVRLVVHYDIPPSLEDYYQEAGRAGRDGKPSYAVILAAERDKSRLRRRVDESFPPKEDILLLYARLMNFLSVAVGEGYDTFREFNIEKFCEVFGYKDSMVKSSLRILTSAGYIDFIEEADIKARVLMTCSRDDLYSTRINDGVVSQVLNALLRMYSGLFSEYSLINEHEIASLCGVSHDDVCRSLISLSHDKIIHYIPKKRIPYIHITTSREETRYMYLPKEAYDERREVFSGRIESMIDYAFKGGKCRVSRMLNYFGETDASECNTCDVCRDKRKHQKMKNLKRLTVAEVYTKVMQQINVSESGVSLIKLLESVPGYDEDVRNIVRELTDRGIAVIEGKYIRNVRWNNDGVG